MAVSFTLGLPVIVIAIILYYKHRKRRQRDALIEKFINSGKDVPAELLASWELHLDESNKQLHQGIKLGSHLTWAVSILTCFLSALISH